MARDLDRLMRLSEGLVAERVERGRSSDSVLKDLFSYLLGAKDPKTTGLGMSHRGLTAKAGTLMVAGMLQAKRRFCACY